MVSTEQGVIGPCHVSGIFLPLRVNSLPLATIYEVKIPLRKWKISLLQRNPAQMTWPYNVLFICKTKSCLRRRHCGLAHHFKTDPNESVAFIFYILYEYEFQNLQILMDTL
jgi:hypothetical protein